MIRTRFIRSTLASGLIGFALVALPARADALNDEIAYLIDFVRHSACTFIRNGREYDAGQAADHVRQKFEYYKDEIRTVEDFIDRAATRSILSGRPYEVRCGDRTVPAADWLRAEATAYRDRMQ